MKQSPSFAEYRKRERWSEQETMHSELLYLFHELSRLVSVTFDRAMAAHSLTHSQWWALMHIFEHDGATQTELADYMGMGRAAAGVTLRRLETKGWIARSSDPGDARVRRIKLADGAVEIFETMDVEAAKLFRTMLSDLSMDDESMLVQKLMHIKANAESMVGVPDPFAP